MTPFVFVDANIFLRLFVRDDEAQYRRAAALLTAAEAGTVALLTGPPVLFEVAWTLKTSYQVPRQEVAKILASITGLKGLELTDKHLVQEALQAMERHGQEFADAYIHATSKARGAAVATFNRRDFDKPGAALHEF